MKKLATAVFLIFLVLKLIGIITWSWIWIFAPLWIPFVFWAVVIIAVPVLITVGTALIALFI